MNQKLLLVTLVVIVLLGLAGCAKTSKAAVRGLKLLVSTYIPD